MAEFPLSPEVSAGACDHRNDRDVEVVRKAPERLPELQQKEEEELKNLDKKWRQIDKQKKQDAWRRQKITRGAYIENIDALEPDALIEAFGTDDSDFISGLSQQLLVTLTNSQHDALSFAISVIRSLKPRDRFEAMLVAQMCALHIQMMKWSSRLKSSSSINELQIAERIVSKSTRAFSSHMETLQRYRMGADRRVTVHHVSVSDGGRAIVGNVNDSGNRAHALPQATTTALPDARRPAMESLGERERAQVLKSDGDTDHERPPAEC